MKIVKNKVAPPFKVAEFDVIYGEGASRVGSLLDIAVDQEIIRKSGAWFSYKEERIGQGRENAKAYLKEHPDVYKEVEDTVMSIIRNKDVSSFGDDHEKEEENLSESESE